MNNDGKNQKVKEGMEEKVKKAESFLKTLFASKRLLIVTALVIVAIIFFIGVITSKSGKTKTDVYSVLVDKKVISELSTMYIPYSSIYKAEEPKKKETDKTKYKYYASYEGYVKLGIDFKKAKIEEKINTNEVYIKLPMMRITEQYVNMDSINIIFEDKKYDKEGYIIEVKKECQKDMSKKITDNARFYSMAKESTIATINHLLEPLIKKKNKKIIVEIEQ